MKRTGSSSSLASLSSMSSVQMHLPTRKGADFLNDDELWDRGSVSIAPADMAAFKALSQNVQPRDVIPEVVRNKRFNRHMDVLPDPRTRVVLPMINGDEATTYVNANYVRGADGKAKSYICAMGPLPATLKNWWRMIWQEKVTCIAMVTGLVEKGVKKCERYWAPKPGQKVKVADMFVRTVAVSEGKGYLRTLLEIQHTSGQTRKVMHLWYHSWPDHGVPRTEDGKPDATNLLYLIRDARRSEKQLSVGGPLLTHCSAGVGRSGTLIALDIACQLLDANKRVDLVEVVKAIRNDRVALVQHPQQYELTHAGCVLYAEFVEAGVSTTETAKGAPVSFNRQAFEREVEAKKFSGVNNEQEITQDLYEEVPEAKQEHSYGQIGSAIKPKAAAKPPQEEVYGQMTPAGVYGQQANAGPINPDDMYGAPVQPTLRKVPRPDERKPAAEEPAANPFGHVKLKKVEQRAEDDEEDEQEANEYSVMKHVPIAQQQLLYEDAEEDSSAAATNANGSANADMYGAPVAPTANAGGAQDFYDNDQAATQSMYGNQQVVDQEEGKVVAASSGEQYFNHEALAAKGGVTATEPQLYENEGAEKAAAEAERERREKRAKIEQQIDELSTQLRTTEADLHSVTREREIAERKLDGIDMEVKQCQVKLRNAKNLERDASIALQQAETALESQREQVEQLSKRMSEAQQKEVEEKERLRKEAEAMRTASILSAVGLSSATTGVRSHAQVLALAMQTVARGKSIPQVRRKVVTDRTAALESQREAVTDIKLLAAVGVVSRYR